MLLVSGVKVNNCKLYSSMGRAPIGELGDQSRISVIKRYRVKQHEDVRSSTAIKQLTSSEINNNPS